MGIFSRLLGKGETTEFDDPVFGEIAYSESDGFWETEKGAQLDAHSVDVWVDAGEEGTFEAQREFYKRVLSGYPELWARIVETFAQYVEGVSGPDEVTGSFVPTILYIPKEREDGSFYWKIWYDRRGEEHWSYGVEIDGWDKIIPFAED